jgi:hypothetical protein
MRRVIFVAIANVTFWLVIRPLIFAAELLINLFALTVPVIAWFKVRHDPR